VDGSLIKLLLKLSSLLVDLAFPQSITKKVMMSNQGRKGLGGRPKVALIRTMMLSWMVKTRMMSEKASARLGNDGLVLRMDGQILVGRRPLTGRPRGISPEW